MLHPLQREFGRKIVGKQAVSGLTLELDHHVDLSLFLVDVL